MIFENYFKMHLGDWGMTSEPFNSRKLKDWPYGCDDLILFDGVYQTKESISTRIKEVDDRFTADVRMQFGIRLENELLKPGDQA